MDYSFSLPAAEMARFNQIVVNFYAAAFERGPLEASYEAVRTLVSGQLHLAFVTRGRSEVLFPGGIGERPREFLMATMGAAASHPLIYRTGDKVMAISDVLSRQEWNRRGMYQVAEAYLKMEDSLGADLSLDDETTLSVCVIREERGYDERERMRLDLLLPHLRAAWRMFGDQTNGQGVLRILSLDELPGSSVALQLQVIDCLDAAIPHPAGPEERNFAEKLAQAIQQMRVGAWAARKVGSTQILRMPRSQGACSVVLVPPSADQPGSLVIRQDGKGSEEGCLTPREREVGQWLCEGKTNEEIAIILGIRPGTVKRHLENLYAKLEVPNRMAAARKLMQR